MTVENRAPQHGAAAARPWMRMACLLAFFAVVAAAGCSHLPPETERSKTPSTAKPYRVLGKWYHPIDDPTGFEQHGLASWYGEAFHGRKTSNGEIFDMNAVSAAHKTLPLGTYVTVTNKDNGKELTLRVNDRGPFVQGRIIDLSKEAARRLGVFGPGTANVMVRALGRPAKPVTAGRTGALPERFTPVDYGRGDFTFQVGAFLNPRNAEAFRERLARTYQNAHVAVGFNGEETVYRVRVGRCHDLETAERYERTLVEHGFHDVFVVAQ